MVVWKRCMIYDRRGLGLTGFIPSASPSVQHLYFTRTCSILLNRTPLLKLSRAFQFQLSRVSLIKNEQGGNYSWGLLSFLPQTNLRVSRKRLHLLQSSLNRFSRTSQTLCHWHLELGWGIKGREESTCGSTCSVLDSESVYFFMPSLLILSCSSNHASFTLPSATLFIHGCTRTEDGLYSLSSSLTPISRTLSLLQ